MTIPFNPETVNIFDMLKSGTAFSPHIVGNVVDVGAQFQSVAQNFLSQVPAFSGQVPTVNNFMQNGVNRLTGHLQNHLSNLPSNLGMMSSFANDLVGMGRASPLVKCIGLDQAFGSIMGEADRVMGQALGQLTNVVGGMASMVTSGFLSNVLQTGALSALQQVPGLEQIGNQINQVMGTINDVASLPQVAAIFNALGAVQNLSQLGSLGSLLTSPQQLLAVGNALQTLGDLIPSFGIAEEFVGEAFGQLTGAFQQAFAGLNGFLGQIGGMMNIIGNIPGMVMGAVNQVIDQAMGALNGVIGEIGDMITRELGALGEALTNLKILAGAINLPSLFNTNECAKAVLGAVASSGLRSALKI